MKPPSPDTIRVLFIGNAGKPLGQVRTVDTIPGGGLRDFLRGDELFPFVVAPAIGLVLGVFFVLGCFGIGPLA